MCVYKLCALKYVLLITQHNKRHGAEKKVNNLFLPKKIIL